MRTLAQVVNPDPRPRPPMSADAVAADAAACEFDMVSPMDFERQLQQEHHQEQAMPVDSQ